ncbi:hypothetical protein K1719_042390, partial [Acacia pycnantha]
YGHGPDFLPLHLPFHRLVTQAIITDAGSTMLN